MSAKSRKVLAIIVIAALSAAIIVKCTELIPLNEQFQKEMAATPTVTPPWGNVMAVTPEPGTIKKRHLLKQGSFGEQVSDMQQRLHELGYYDGDIDGKFGQGTGSAVSWFQRENGLTEDGIAGEDTLTALYSNDAKKPGS